MNNDNDLNLHSMTKLSGWLRYWVRVVFQESLPHFLSISNYLKAEHDDL